MKFTKMDRQTAQEITRIAQRALTDAFASAGIEVRFDGGKYDDHTFTPRVTFALAGGIEDKQREEFARHAVFLGLKASDYGRTFEFRGQTYKLCGVRPRAGKYPLVGVDNSGKRMCFMASTARRYFGY